MSETLHDDRQLAATAFERAGMAGGNTRVLIATTDSMAPTIERGDYLLLDVTVTKHESDGVYALDNPGGPPLIRRCLRVLAKGDIMIGRDNPLYAGAGYEASSYEFECNVLGRVVVVGRTLDPDGLRRLLAGAS